MTPVHVNRILHPLGGEGIIGLSGKTLTATDLSAVMEKADRLQFAWHPISGGKDWTKPCLMPVAQLGGR